MVNRSYAVVRLLRMRVVLLAAVCIFAVAGLGACATTPARFRISRLDIRGFYSGPGTGSGHRGDLGVDSRPPCRSAASAASSVRTSIRCARGRSRSASAPSSWAMRGSARRPTRRTARRVHRVQQRIRGLSPQCLAELRSPRRLELSHGGHGPHDLRDLRRCRALEPRRRR